MSCLGTGIWWWRLWPKLGTPNKLAAQIFDIHGVTQIRDFAAVRSNQAAIACYSEACVPSGRAMFPAEDCADDIWSQQRETEQSCRIRRDYTLRFGDFFKGEGLVRKHSISDHMGADERAYQARIRSFGMGSILDNYLHLIANALETHRNR